VVNEGYTDRLVAYASAFRYEDLPWPAIDAAKLIILLDTIGTILLGSQPKYAAS
jgi:hypothetical protein